MTNFPAVRTKVAHGITWLICAEGHEWGSIRPEEGCPLCHRTAEFQAKGRPECKVVGCHELVTCADRAFEAGERRCSMHAYGDWMEAVEESFAPLLDPFREMGYQAEVLQTGGNVMLPMVWLDEPYTKGIGISDEVDENWSCILYLGYNTEGMEDTWKELDFGQIRNFTEDDEKAGIPEIVTKVKEYITSGQVDADLAELLTEYQGGMN